MIKRISMADVAHEAGVAKGTVSRALSANPSRFGIAAAMVERVQMAAAKLGYHATREELRRVVSVGLVFRSGSLDTWFGGVYAGLPAALADELDQRGHELVLVPIRPRTVLARLAHARGLDACVLTDPVPYDLISELRQRRWPAVVVNAAVEGCDLVLADDRAAVADVFARLAALGHRRAVYLHHLPNADHISGSERLAAAVAAEALIVTSPDAALDAVAGGATAVVAYGAGLTVEVGLRLRECDLLPGRDIALVSADDNPVLNLLQPRIARIQVPMAAMARAAVPVLLDGEPGGRAPRHLLIPCSFDAGETMCALRRNARSKRRGPLQSPT